ncbi:MAG: biotin--[acetyl-CoA-carboxylase] ligase [Clostridiales bacterium]|nr:biotin--[acetyl-CoA-carboxylase] ligase [Clostridiales bacterium]
MSLKDDVLYELLSAEDYVSGEELADKYSKSRAAVWKAVHSLKSQGYDISTVTNKGYRLTENNNIISAGTVKSRLGYDADVIYYPSVDSTNNQCRRFLADGRQGTFLVIADEQTAGRGRQGKDFYSPAGTGVYFSLAVNTGASLSSAVTVTTAAAVAVCRAIESITDLKPGIKWVNDVYVNGKKVCGILTEAVTNFETSTVESVIIGIGINVSTTDFPSNTGNAGSLGSGINRSELIAETVNNLMRIIDGDYSMFIDYYRSRSIVIGKKIDFIEKGVSTPATVLSIDERGELEVELDSGEKRVLRSGEISVRNIT